MIDHPVRNASQIREFMAHQTAFVIPGLFPTKGMQGAITGALNKHLGGDVNRRLVLGWLFADDNAPLVPLSSHTLSDMQWSLLDDWVGLYKDEDENAWRVRTSFPYEAAIVLTAVITAYNALGRTERAALGDQLDATITTAVELGGQVTYANDNKTLDTPKFDELVRKTTFGSLLLGNTMDKDSL